MTEKVVVIVLHYNGIADTLACLETLAPQRHPGLEVLVVDNGSVEPVAPLMLQHFVGIPVLRLDENRGWAGGNNAGIEWALARDAGFVCLLNNDTLVPLGAIDVLARTAHALGPCLLHPAIDFADPSEGVQLDPSTAPGATPLAGHDGVYELDEAYGACLMIPVEVFRRIGVLDERFFLQLEEADFHRRAMDAGLRALCLPSTRIVHKESRSFGGRVVPLKMYYSVRNRLLLAEKHDRRPIGYARALRYIYWSAANEAARGAPVSSWRTLGWLLTGDPLAASIRRGVRDYLLRRFGAYKGRR